MTWAAVMVALKKAWAWIKKHWQLFVGMAVPVVIYLVTRRPPNLSKVLDRVRDDYDKEISAIERANDQERKDKEAAVKRYQEALTAIEKKYQEKNESLDQQKRAEVEKILKDHGDDPDEITRRLSELTGFEIYVK